MSRRVQFSDDGLRLVTGLGTQDDFYEFSTEDNSDIKRIDLNFSQNNWWTQLANNYESETDIAATMAYDGEMLDASVGVSFKGETSYERNPTEKKSFNIALDFEDSTQDLDGFNSLNLNCAWGDDTFMREVIYEHINQHYIPAASVNYVELYINDEYWGIYINSQQLDNNFIKEWFTSTNGSRWRAEPLYGRADHTYGTSGLTYRGDTLDDYTSYYTMKRYCWSDPWDDLINLCYALEYTSEASMEEDISEYLDVDRTLWFLAMENIFADEDGYINKGGGDYYLYWDDTTGLLTPLEYDGNSILVDTEVSTGGRSGGGPEGYFLEWSPFENADNRYRPLLYKLLNVPAIRQRYLAHMRTVLIEDFNETDMNAIIDAYASKIGPYIDADPKTFITDFDGAVESLKNAVTTRCTSLWSNAEFNVTGLTIFDVKWIVGTTVYATPISSDAIDEVIFNATVEDLENGGGVASVYAYLGEGIKSTYSMVQMFDDGTHKDGLAGDGVYGTVLDEKASSKRTRFYIEAIAGDSPGTRTYFPAGAAHDVYTFMVDE